MNEVDQVDELETTQITQVSSVLNFANDLNIQSASDATITASKLSADTGTILTGKFRDGFGTETITNTDAKLNINSAFDTYKHTVDVEKVNQIMILHMSALLGGIVLVIADAIARKVLAPAQLPVGAAVLS